MFTNLKEDREEKLRSLLTNCMSLEIEKTSIAVNKVLLTEKSRKKWNDALFFALTQSYGDREVDKYYITHPLRLCRFLVNTLDPKSLHFEEILIAAIIHNVIEKEVYSYDELKIQYGLWIAEAIRTLTPDR